jgi:glycosyltransferase involved in cell wall biosynthesis
MISTEIFPQVSITTLSFNTGKYVIEALDCVKRQNYPNIQHIIIDDCSTDNSVAIIGEWILSNNYDCLFIKHQMNMGVQKSLEEAFSLTTGKYWAGICDDLWPDNKLMDQITIFESLDDSYAMVYGDTQMISEDGTLLFPSMFEHFRGVNFSVPCGNIYHEVLKGFFFYIQASIIRLSHFKKIEYTFDPSIISEDWDWQLYLSRDFKIYGTNKNYAFYRYRDGSIGRTIWIPEKMPLVWKSHLVMFLNHYQSSGNSAVEKNILFEKIWVFLNGLLLSKKVSLFTHRKLIKSVLSKISKIHAMKICWRILKLKLKNLIPLSARLTIKNFY